MLHLLGLTYRESLILAQLSEFSSQAPLVFSVRYRWQVGSPRAGSSLPLSPQREKPNACFYPGKTTCVQGMAGSGWAIMSREEMLAASHRGCLGISALGLVPGCAAQLLCHPARAGGQPGPNGKLLAKKWRDVCSSISKSQSIKAFEGRGEEHAVLREPGTDKILQILPVNTQTCSCNSLLNGISISSVKL